MKFIRNIVVAAVLGLFAMRVLWPFLVEAIYGSKIACLPGAISLSIDGRPQELDEKGCFWMSLPDGRHRIESVDRRARRTIVDLYLDHRRDDESAISIEGHEVSGIERYKIIK